MKQGDILTVTISGYGSEGQGIAKLDNFVIFVPFTVKGEKVKVKIDYVKKNYATASIIELIETSDKRVKPPCNRFTRCGGCDIMHIEYAEQLSLKREALINTFRKNYKGSVIIEDCIQSPEIFGYRNKISLPFGIVNGKVALGFYHRGTHKLVSITKCFLQGEWAESLIKVMLDYANSNDISVYDEKTGNGVLRHVAARYIEGEISIALVVNADEIPYQDKLIALLDKQFKKYSLYLSVNRKRNNVIMGDTVELIKGDPLTAEINGIRYCINPLSFLQVNNEIRDKIYNAVIEKVIENMNGAVIDAYAGVGLLGAMLAKRGINVTNIEIVPEATADADTLAKDNNVSHLVTNICGDAAVVLPKILNSLKNTYPSITIILDPPRKGCSKEVLDALNALAKSNIYNDICENNANVFIDTKNDIDLNCNQSNCKAQSNKTLLQSDNTDNKNTTIDNFNKANYNDNDNQSICNAAHIGEIIQSTQETPKINIIYISCNPATLSRDLAILSPNYSPTSITPYDMFPHTKHLETLVCIKRK